MRATVRRLLVASLLATTAGWAYAKCDATGADAADIANARAAVAAQCDCAGAANHGTYVRCAADVARATLVNQSCRGQVVRCAANSTCGKAGFITCCTRNAKGKVRCSIKRDCSKCKPPRGGEACCGTQPSCCDACDETQHPPCAGSPSGAFLDNATAF